MSLVNCLFIIHGINLICQVCFIKILVPIHACNGWFRIKIGWLRIKIFVFIVIFWPLYFLKFLIALKVKIFWRHWNCIQMLILQITWHFWTFLRWFRLNDTNIILKVVWRCWFLIFRHFKMITCRIRGYSNKLFVSWAL